MIENTDDQRWQQVMQRDRSADDDFVYGVRTTGIYCRPSCSARLAKRAHVSFFADSKAAEAAGYRACLRCRPNTRSLHAANRAIMEQACRLIEQSEEALSLEALAARMGMSPYHFHRQFKALIGITPKAYAQAHRGHQLRRTLAHSENSVTEAIYQSGFNTSSRFYEEAPRQLGMSPDRYRQGGKGMDIEYAVGETTLGCLLVARSERGVCAISLGREVPQLVGELHQLFPQARLIEASLDLTETLEQIVQIIEQPGTVPDLPLDIRGTAFQQRVWEALRRIPAGHRLSYTALAEAIGSPRAVRAVASACAANRHAVIIPCHRIVRSDGSISGYRWGVERKRALLTREAGEE